MEVREISVEDPATHAQLRRHLLQLDLVRTVSAHRPLPDLLAHLLLDVTNAVLPANAGRWRVSADVAGGPGVARPTRDNPDLLLDISELGAAHLGATHLADLALSGRVQEQTAGALTAASLAWSWSPTATCLEVF